MDLTLSDEQRLLRESADRFVNETLTPTIAAGSAADPLGFARKSGSKFAELGWLALPIGEEYGGLGGGAVETSLSDGSIRTRARHRALSLHRRDRRRR